MESGYDTRMTGKWHVGFYKWSLTPTFRGFSEFYGFYSGGEDYFTHKNGDGYDFRHDVGYNCGVNCSKVGWEDNGIYSTEVFGREGVRMIEENANSTQPLFLMVTFQGVHSPSQVPQKYVEPFNDTIQDNTRKTFAGMISAVDSAVGNITDALKRSGMYENTVIVFTSDNGGPIQGGDATGTRNWPLRGGKHSIWEGGVKVRDDPYALVSIGISCLTTGFTCAMISEEVCCVRRCGSYVVHHFLNQNPFLMYAWHRLHLSLATMASMID